MGGRAEPPGLGPAGSLAGRMAALADPAAAGAKDAGRTAAVVDAVRALGDGAAAVRPVIAVFAQALAAYQDAAGRRLAIQPLPDRWGLAPGLLVGWRGAWWACYGSGMLPLVTVYAGRVRLDRVRPPCAIIYRGPDVQEAMRQALETAFLDGWRQVSRGRRAQPSAAGTGSPGVRP